MDLCQPRYIGVKEKRTKKDRDQRSVETLGHLLGHRDRENDNKKYEKCQPRFIPIKSGSIKI